MLIIICNVIRDMEIKNINKLELIHSQERRSSGEWSKARLGWVCQRTGWRKWVEESASVGNGKRCDKRDVGEKVLQQQASAREVLLQQSARQREASGIEGRTWNCPHVSWILRASLEQEETPVLCSEGNNLHPLPHHLWDSPRCIPGEWRGKKNKCSEWNALIFTWAREIFFKCKGDFELLIFVIFLFLYLILLYKVCYIYLIFPLLSHISYHLYDVYMLKWDIYGSKIASSNT